MKKIFTLAAMATLFLASCTSEEAPYVNSSDKTNKGFISLNVTNDNGIDTQLSTRAEVTAPNTWNVTITSSANDYNETCAISAVASKSFKAGTDYTLSVASHTNLEAALAENSNRGAAYYTGAYSSGDNNTFSITQGQTTNIAVNCGKAQNTEFKVALNSLSSKVTDCSVAIGQVSDTEPTSGYQFSSNARNITFSSSATSPAYFAANQYVVYQLSYKWNGEQTAKTYTAYFNTGAAGTSTTLSIGMNSNGSIGLTVNYDNEWTSGTAQTVTIDAATGNKAE